MVWMDIQQPFSVFPASNLIGEVCVLEDMTSHLPVIEIRIEECRGMGSYQFRAIIHILALFKPIRILGVHHSTRHIWLLWLLGGLEEGFTDPIGFGGLAFLLDKILL